MSKVPLPVFLPGSYFVFRVFLIYMFFESFQKRFGVGGREADGHDATP